MHTGIVRVNTEQQENPYTPNTTVGAEGIILLLCIRTHVFFWCFQQLQNGVDRPSHLGFQVVWRTHLCGLWPSDDQTTDGGKQLTSLVLARYFNLLSVWIKCFLYFVHNGLLPFHLLCTFAALERTTFLCDSEGLKPKPGTRCVNGMYAQKTCIHHFTHIS